MTTRQVSLRLDGPATAPVGSTVTYRVTLTPSAGPRGTIFATFGAGLTRNAPEQRRAVVDGKMTGPPLTFTAMWVGFNHLRVVFVPPPNSSAYAPASAELTMTVTFTGA